MLEGALPLPKTADGSLKIEMPERLSVDLDADHDWHGRSANTSGDSLSNDYRY